MAEKVKEAMDLSVFNQLEQRVEELLARLRDVGQENADLRSRLEEKDRELSEMMELASEAEAERNQIRQKVEQLLGKLETL
jgi:septal ring factor EnvC (AmiA/AmiB activator)